MRKNIKARATLEQMVGGKALEEYTLEDALYLVADDDFIIEAMEKYSEQSFVILRETLQKELEAFQEAEKGVGSKVHAHYEGIHIGLRIAINHIIQQESL